MKENLYTPYKELEQILFEFLEKHPLKIADFVDMLEEFRDNLIFNTIIKALGEDNEKQ